MSLMAGRTSAAWPWLGVAADDHAATRVLQDAEMAPKNQSIWCQRREQVGFAMAYNFLRRDRDQPFLLPPDLRDWLPEGHLAWFVLDVVDHLELTPFLRAYRNDGHGHPAYDPKTLLGVLLYAYCIGVRSSRQVERRCVEDVAFRVLAGNQAPDHVTIARFRVRHQQALAEFLVESLRLCAAAGMVRLGVVALDGTKVAANAAERANRTLAKVEDEVAEILRQAAEADRREDRAHGEERGDELPAALASKAGRLQRLRVAKVQLQAEAAERQRRYEQRVAELAAAARGPRPAAQGAHQAAGTRRGAQPQAGCQRY
jgi:transposase